MKEKVKLKILVEKKSSNKKMCENWWRKPEFRKVSIMDGYNFILEMVIVT